MKTAAAAILALGMAAPSEYADTRIREYANEVAPLPPRGETFPPAPAGGSTNEQSTPQDLAARDESFAREGLKLAEDLLRKGAVDEARFLAGVVGTRVESSKEWAAKVIQAARDAKPKPGAGAEEKLAAFVKIWSVQWRMDHRGGRPGVESELIESLVEQAKAFVLFNRRRAEAGIGKVDYDFNLAYGCQMHARYLALHPDNENPHTEDEEASGYSKEGKQAAENSVIGYENGIADVIDVQLATVFHRKRLLDRATVSMGLGSFLSANKQRTTVIDVGSTASESETPEVMYPSNGSVDVPTLMQPENPSPVPNEVRTTCGFPITLSFSDDDVQIQDASGRLTQGARAVDCYFSCPNKPGSPKIANNWGILALIPKQALKSKTTYNVTFEFKRGEKTLKREWSFTTGPKAN